ncbi:MAG: protein-glutamate O-methyltransferase CheR [Nitrospirota bacterium]|nr:protein-glutamate O-methyltransferase CheR [Nitrospirota bacterium]
MSNQPSSPSQTQDQDYELFKKKLVRLVNIDLDYYKEAQMKRRITSFRDQAGINSFILFVNQLEKDPVLKKKFVDYLTINVSELFRDHALFAKLEKEFIPQLLKRSPRLNIWSAGCSIGAEAYTLAIILDKLVPNSKHRIFGTDLDEEIIKRAATGVYSKEEVRQVEQPILDKYFSLKDNKYHLHDSIKSRVTFKKHNLLNDPYETDIDLICCRNVVIYFTEEAKQKLYRRFFDALKPGGILFVGGTETILSHQAIGFKLSQTFFYEKPL